jgi:hypothetical protein
VKKNAARGAVKKMAVAPKTKGKLTGHEGEFKSAATTKPTRAKMSMLKIAKTPARTNPSKLFHGPSDGANMLMARKTKAAAKKRRA